MRESPLRLIKRCVEFEPKENVKRVPTRRRGLYVLYAASEIDGAKYLDVVYVGLARSGIRGRLDKHARSKKKADRWTHFSAFEVWDNIRDDEIVELEGLFSHIYRTDSRANALNVQRTFKKVVKLNTSLEAWD